MLITPTLIKKLKAHGIVGVDVHKPAKPICTEMGGLAILFSFMGALLPTYTLLPSLIPKILPTFITILTVGLIGIIDDLFVLKQRYKPVLVAFASTPIILANPNYTEIWFPIFGLINFGIFGPILIPLGVATASNLTNMLAGFNGLEAGIGAIACGALSVLCILLGGWEAALLALPLSAAFIAFLRYNWYPAKIFPGDTGTLVSGAAIASISILGHVEIAAIVMLAPAAIDFTLKMISKTPFSQRKVYGDTSTMSDGTLVPPPYPSLCHAFMSVTRLREKDLVLALLFMQILYAIFGSFLFIAL